MKAKEKESVALDKTIGSQAALLARQVASLRVTDESSKITAVETVQRIIQNRKRLNEAFDPTIESAKETLASARGAKARYDEPLKNLEGIVRARIKAYDDEQELIRFRIERENQEKSEAYQEKLSTAKRPSAIRPPELQMVSQGTKIEGFQTRKVVRWEITDDKKVPEKYRVISEELLGADLRRDREKLTPEKTEVIPGVLAWLESSGRIG